ncbi:hypothetical protein ABIT13_14325 [Limnospira fusiformis NRMCF6962]
MCKYLNCSQTASSCTLLITPGYTEKAIACPCQVRSLIGLLVSLSNKCQG